MRALRGDDIKACRASLSARSMSASDDFVYKVLDAIGQSGCQLCLRLCRSGIKGQRPLIPPDRFVQSGERPRFVNCGSAPQDAVESVEVLDRSRCFCRC